MHNLSSFTYKHTETPLIARNIAIPLFFTAKLSIKGVQIYIGYVIFCANHDAILMHRRYKWPITEMQPIIAYHCTRHLEPRKDVLF